MEKVRGRWLSYGAAATLSLLTLGVFSILQDYGPESAIRRFHEAVLRRDGLELQRVTGENVKSQSVRLLVMRVSGFLNGGTYQLLRMERTPGQVKAAVVYRERGSQDIFPMIWVVEKRGPAWKVNAEKTLTILRDNLGM